MKRWKHYFAGKYVIFSILIIYMLLWVSSGWIDAAGKAHINLELFKNWTIVEEYGISLFLNSFGGGIFTLFSPLIAGYTAVMFRIDKENCGFSKIEIFRTGKRAYITESFFLTCMITGIVYLTAYTFYAISLVLLSGNIKVLFAYGIIIKNMPCIFLYGAANSVLSQIISCFMKSRYLTVCIPFLFCYLYSRTFEYIYLQMLNQGNIRILNILNSLFLEAVLNRNMYSIVITGLFICFGYYIYRYLYRLKLNRGV